MEEETRIAGGEGRAVGGKQGRRQAENPENPSNLVNLENQLTSKMKKGKIKVTVKCEAISSQTVPWKAFQHD